MNDKGKIMFVSYDVSNEYDENHNLTKTINIGLDKNFNTTALYQYDKNNRIVSKVLYTDKTIIHQLTKTYIGDLEKSIAYYMHSSLNESEYLNDKLIKSTFINEKSTTTTMYEDNGNIKSRIEIDKNGKEINREEYEYITIEL